jgi:ribonuclease HIII
VVRVNPPRFRELARKLSGERGVEAWAHGKALAGLLRAYPDCDHARVVDLEGLGLEEVLPELGGALELRAAGPWEQEPGAWAARMLARHEYLGALAKLGEQAGLELPADPGPEQDRALELLSRRGPGIIRQLAKGSPPDS